ncbi:hypothetical protein KCU78_g3163, partial [Aureobasidium melanogenum]
MKEVTTTLMLSEQEATDQPFDAIFPAQDLTNSNISCHDSDNEPMVYETPVDYATSARQERERLIAQGTDPNTIILQSELHNHIPQRRKDESTSDFAERYSQAINAMITSGVSILNDQCTADVVASAFGTADGRFFDLGPGSGATKREFREFGKWFEEVSRTGQVVQVPDRWLKFEKKRPATTVEADLFVY